MGHCMSEVDICYIHRRRKGRRGERARGAIQREDILLYTYISSLFLAAVFAYSVYNASDK
jgi:hypothetical protein